MLYYEPLAGTIVHVTPSWIHEPRHRGTPNHYLRAARVPDRLRPQSFGPWTIRRVNGLTGIAKLTVGWGSQTLLHRHCGQVPEVAYPFDDEPARMVVESVWGDLVMEDSRNELIKHLPIWLAARGRVLVTGLGLGCVVRGLLANREVDHIDVVELDRHILRVVGHEFMGNRRVALHHGDALTFALPGPWDFAWHDLWCPKREDGTDELQLLHWKLIRRLRHRCGAQGAWALPRWVKRMARERGVSLIG